MFRYLPEQASEIAPRVDWIHHWITDISVFFTVAIVGTAIYFTVRYRRQNNKDHETPRIEGNSLIEIIWTVIPTFVCIWLAYTGGRIFVDMNTVPPNEEVVEVYVEGRKWQWDFEYPQGKKVSGKFVLPVNKQARLIMRSSDVLHSFFIPAMRVKKDVIPGRFTDITFKPVKTGEYYSFCTEFCGDLHSSMLAMLKVVPEAEFERWVQDRSEEEALAGLSPVDQGAALYGSQNCVQCHSTDGKPGIGPTFLKIFGQTRTFTDGTTAKIDEEYLRESIAEPGVKIAQGFGPVMPAVYADALTDDQVLSLVAFIKSLDGSAPVQAESEKSSDESAEETANLSPEERGKKLYETRLCITCHSLDGSKLVGPSLQGLYGKNGKLADGSEYAADDAYIRTSILQPNEQFVEGYAGGMPPYEGQLSDEDIADLIEFIKTVK